VVDATEGSAEWDRQVRALYDYWAAVPWERYWAQWGAKGVHITPYLSRDDDGTLRAGWSGVVPSRLRLLALEPIAVRTDRVVPSSALTASNCQRSNSSTSGTTCVYNRVGPGASQSQWTNNSSTLNYSFRMRTGYALFSGATCFNTTNRATGAYATVRPGNTYVLSFTSTQNTTFAVAGYDNGLTVRKFLDCTGYL